MVLMLSSSDFFSIGVMPVDADKKRPFLRKVLGSAFGMAIAAVSFFTASPLSMAQKSGNEIPKGAPSNILPGDSEAEEQDALPASAAAVPSGFPRQFDSFSALRNGLLDVVSRSTKRVWLTTDYLTDGEIVSALYIAQYRKLDVKVLLSRPRANGYMSRLNYLKNQNVPVFIRPDNFRISKPTAILCDDNLVYVDSELDFLTRKRSFVMSAGSSDDSHSYSEAFATAAGQMIPAVPHPLPLVGRAGNPNWHAPGAGGKRLPPIHNNYSAPMGPGEGGAAYIYDNARTAKPPGVPDRLPRETILQRQGSSGDGKK